MEGHMGTLAEQLIQRGRNEGIQEGQREMLTRQLALKFGVLPGAVRDRLAKATVDELGEYTLRVLAAATLDAVFE